MSKFTMLAAFGAGYVLGSRAGRERYEQIATKAQQFWKDPRVQRTTSQAQGFATEKASQAASAVGEKAAEAASSVQGSVKDKVSGNSSSTGAKPGTNANPGTA